MAPWKSETPGQARGISPFFILAIPSQPKSRDLEMTGDGPYEIEFPGRATLARKKDSLFPAEEPGSRDGKQWPW
jgi:hypothetical protein